MIAVFIRFKRCRVRLIPYNFYYFDGGGGSDEEYNIILYTACILYYILRHAETGPITIHIYNNNCKLLFFSRSSCTSISFFLIFTISFSLRVYASLFHSSYPCLLRQRISQLSSGRATIILRLIYAIPRLHPSHVAPPARHPCDGRWTHVLRRRVYVYNSSSSEIARFDSDLRRTHTHTHDTPIAESWNLKPSRWACLLIWEREFVTTVEINPRDCFLILVAFFV